MPGMYPARAAAGRGAAAISGAAIDRAVTASTELPRRSEAPSQSAGLADTASGH